MIQSVTIADYDSRSDDVYQDGQKVLKVSIVGDTVFLNIGKLTEKAKEGYLDEEKFKCESTVGISTVDVVSALVSLITSEHAKG